MPRFGARSFRSVLAAIALSGALVVPAAAAPAAWSAGSATAGTTGTAAKARVARDVDYRVTITRGGDTSRTSGEFDWTRKRVRNDGRLVDHGDGYAALSFQHTLADGTVVSRGANAQDERVPIGYTINGDVRRITVFLCKAGGSAATTCTSRTYTR